MREFKVISCQEKEKQQRNNWHTRRCGSFVIWLQLHFSSYSPIFSPNWEDSILVDPRRKHLDPTNLRFSLLTNQTPTKTILSPLFSLPFSIITKISPTTQTFSVFKMMVNWESRWRNPRCIREIFVFNKLQWSLIYFCK